MFEQAANVVFLSVLLVFVVAVVVEVLLTAVVLALQPCHEGVSAEAEVKRKTPSEAAVAVAVEAFCILGKSTES